MFVRNWKTVCCIVRTVQSIFATALKPSQLVHLVLCFVMGYVLQFGEIVHRVCTCARARACVCVCACVRACVCACARARVCVFVCRSGPSI